MKLKSVKKIIFRNTIKKKNQPQNRNFDRQLSKHPTVFEYAHDYLDNRLTNSLGVSNEQAPPLVSYQCWADSEPKYIFSNSTFKQVGRNFGAMKPETNSTKYH